MKKYRAPAYNICRKFISYISIGILVLNIGLANAAISSDEKILLCTSQGYIWVSLNEITANTDSDPLTTNAINIHKCPFCTFGPDDNDDIIQSFYGPKPYAINDRHLVTQVTRLPHTALLHSSLQSRAPPI